MKNKKTERKRAFQTSKDSPWMHHKINDILLAKIKVQASYYEFPNDPNEDRYLYITKEKYREIRRETATQMKCSEKTIDRSFRELLYAGLMTEFSFQKTDKKYCYGYGVTQEAAPFVLLTQEWLRYLATTDNIHSIKIYVYLLDKYLWKKKSGEMYNFTINELMDVIEYEKNSGRGREVINNILHEFYQRGIIKYENCFVNIEGSPIQYKQLQYLAQNEQDRQNNSERIWHIEEEQ